MRRLSLVAVAGMLMAAFMIAPAVHAQKGIKGDWTLSLQLPDWNAVRLIFQANQRGYALLGKNRIDFVYRERGATVSALFEIPGGLLVTGNVSVALRGTRTDTTFAGKALLISDVADDAGPLGFKAVTAPFSAIRIR